MSRPFLPSLALAVLLQALICASLQAQGGGSTQLTPFGLLLPDPVLLDSDASRQALDFIVTSSATSSVKTTLTLRFKLSLKDSSDNEVASTAATKSYTIPAGQPVRIEETISLAPQAWLDGQQFHAAEVVVEMAEDGDPTFSPAGNASLPSLRIFDATGAIQFANIGTTIPSLAAAPTYNARTGIWELTLSAGTALPLEEGQSLTVVADETVTVQNTNGALNVLGAEIETGPGGEIDYEDWEIALDDTVLDENGLIALGFIINLPACIGREDSTTGLLEDTLVVSTPLALNAKLEPLFNARGTFATPITIVSEDFPLRFQVDRWALRGDTLRFPEPATYFTRVAQFDQWLSVKGELPTSNDAFWYFVDHNGSGDLDVQTGDIPGIDVVLRVEPELFATHFPLAFIQHSGGTITIEDSEIVTGTPSRLDDFTAHVPYGVGCAMGSHTVPEPLVDFQVTGDALHFTPETGLYGDGTVGIQPALDPQVPVVTNVRLGRNANDQIVHETNTLVTKDVQFYAPMTRIWGDPHIQVLSGITADATFENYTYPGAYADAEGAVYAGANVAYQENMTAVSRVGGDTLGSYPMTDHTRLYLRTSGGSGIFGADESYLPQALEIGGFDLTIEDWEFSVLSNEQHESDIQGALAVAYPADFTVLFDELFMNCCGNFEEVVLAPGQHQVQLKYWQRSEIEIKNIEFVSGSECATTDPALKVAVEAKVNGVPNDRPGVLHILDNGQLTNAAHPIYPASFLELSPNFELAGGFRTTPVRHAYFNSFAEYDPGEDLGFLNLVVQTKAPFFDPIEIHATTHGFDLLGDDAIENQQVRMNGGWAAGGESHFSHADFDATHTAFPKGAGGIGIDPNNYWNSDSTSYLPEAKRKIWIAPFNFYIKYDPLTCTFAAVEDKGFDLAGVITATGKLPRLTKDETEITFGTGFNLNLSNAFESLVGTAAEAAVGQIDVAFDSIDDFLQARICDLIEVELRAQIDAHISNKLLTALEDAGGQLTNAEIDALIEDCVINELPNLNLGGEILAKIDAKLASIEAGLDQLIVFLDLADAGPIQAYIGASLDNLPCAAGEVAAVEAEVNGSLGDTGFAARLSMLADRAAQLQGFVVELRGAAGFALEVEQTINNGIDQINATYGDVIKDTLRPFLRTVVDELAQFPGTSYNLLNFEERLAVDLGDLLCSFDFMAEFQATVRARVRLAIGYAMKQLVASAFQEIGLFIADVSAEAIVNCSGVGAALDAVAGFSDTYIQAGKFWGHAIISHEELELLRLDGEMVIHSQPIPIRLHPFFEWRSLQSDGSRGCNPALVPVESKEVLVGAIVSPALVKEEDNNITLSSQFAFAQPVGDDQWKPIGFMGRVEINAGGSYAQPLRFDYLSAMLAVSGDGSGSFDNFEMYLAGEAEATINATALSFVPYSNYKLYGGVFIGQTCTPEPLHWASETVQNATPLLGAVAFAEGSFPFYDVGCLVRLKAKAGFEIFGYKNVSGAIAGSSISGEASGDLLCLLSAKGSVNLSTAISFSGDAAFSGSACLKGKVGPCPFCKKFDGCLSTSFSTGNGFQAGF